MVLGINYTNNHSYGSIDILKQSNYVPYNVLSNIIKTNSFL